MTEIREITVAGVRSPVHCVGDSASAEAVVFVHGNPGASDDFQDLLPQVGTFARAIAPDFPGYGKADRPPDFDYTIEGYARHLDGILEQLGIRRVHFVLHDYGCPWGLQWAVDHPDRVASFVLMNMGVMPGYRWHKFARIWRTPLLGELFMATASRPALRVLMNADNPKPFPDAMLDRIWRDFDRGHWRAVLKLYRATPDAKMGSIELAPALKAMRRPALVLWGEGDRYLSAKYAETQKEFFDAEVHTLPGCGHWPMVDEPARVAELVLPFLRKQVKP
jgi:pimeloyl-ACP methyl ester carboxylesterase